MGKANRATRRDLEKVITRIIQELSHLKKVFQALDSYVGLYVEYKGDKISFTEFIESKVKKIEKNNETSHKEKNIKSEKSKRYEKIKSS